MLGFFKLHALGDISARFVVIQQAARAQGVGVDKNIFVDRLDRFFQVLLDLQLVLRSVPLVSGAAG